jgi:cation diffusion facilitator family transporter
MNRYKRVAVAFHVLTISHPMTNSDAAPDTVTHQTRFAMGVSLAGGIAMLATKWVAYAITGSAAILSDASESVIHIVAVAFAAFSLRLSQRPATSGFRYGYERISFFSAGFEGGMIVLAAVLIIWAAVEKWIRGIAIEQLGFGVLMTFAASLVNALLGWYLVRTGRRARSLILEANGKHVLTDSWTSFGVVGGLLLVVFTGWKPFDPLIAIAVALNILWSGAQLIRTAISGLMDYVDPVTRELVRRQLDELCRGEQVEYHGLRLRDTGVRLRVEVHLLFPYDTLLGKAHEIATGLEERFPAMIGRNVDLVTHLEAVEDHSQIHSKGHAT